MAGHRERRRLNVDRPTCATCPYWSSDDGKRGACVRYAPRTIVQAFDGLPDNLESIVPFTRAQCTAGEYCGEHPSFDTWLANERRIRRNAERIANAANIQGDPFSLECMQSLSVRSRKVLIRLGIWPGVQYGGAGDARKLLDTSEADLLAIKNCGASTVADIRRYLGRFGLSLKETPPTAPPSPPPTPRE